MKKIKEKDLYGAIEKSDLFAKNTFYYEVPLGSWMTSRRRVDMVTLKNKKILSIEVKISNWKKCLQQAYVNLYTFDYSYAALWHKVIPNIDIEMYKKLGIGILEINNACNEILKPKRSALVISQYRRYVKNYCKQAMMVAAND